MNVATNPVAFFRLKDAQSYRFWNRNGMRMLDVTKGQVLSAKTREDCEYFRSRPDVLLECTPEGVPLGQLNPGQVDAGKAQSYKVWGRSKNAAQAQAKAAQAPQRPAQPTPSQLAAQPTPPNAVPYGTRIESNPEAAAEDLPIPPDPMADVPLPTANAAMAPATPPFPAEEAPQPAAPGDVYSDMSDDEKMTIQKQRIAAGFAPDPNLPVPHSGDPMIAAIEQQIADNPQLRDALQPLLDTAKATALVKLQQAASAGGLPAADPFRKPDAPRGALLHALQEEAASGRMNSPVEFASPDGTTEALPGR